MVDDRWVDLVVLAHIPVDDGPAARDLLTSHIDHGDNDATTHTSALFEVVTESVVWERGDA